MMNKAKYQLRPDATAANNEQVFGLGGSAAQRLSGSADRRAVVPSRRLSARARRAAAPAAHIRVWRAPRGKSSSPSSKSFFAIHGPR